jgi:predicted extracellular nuclease
MMSRKATAKLALIGKLTFLGMFLACLCFAAAQQHSTDDRQQYRIMFYNVENLFDTGDDPETRDDEFTPQGARYWTQKRFFQKLMNIYKVIVAVGEWEPPAIIGLCEVENRYVLQKLVYDTPLKQFGYDIIHFDSPDRRGIDVAMIYRKDKFTPLHSEPVTVFFPDDTSSKTRDILYVKGLLGDREMVHLFVNHWPSRYGGYMATKAKRNRAAEVLKHKTDSLLGINPNISIVIMGDFNDNPDDESVVQVLNAEKPFPDAQPGKLYNMMLMEQPDWKHGSLKFREHWDTFDHIIVSGGLLDTNSVVSVSPAGAVIFHADFLLQPDERYMGEQLFRTYVGFRYQGGFSDHLPVYVDLIVNLK